MRYDQYKPSGVEWIGEIPKNWEVGRLKWNVSFEYGESLAAGDRNNGSIPVFGSNGIAGFHDTAITKSPCIIIGRKGSFGKVNWSNVCCFPIDTTYFIDESKTRHDLRWLFFLLPNLGLDLFSRDTGVPGLNRDDAYQNKVPIPPREEQTAIVNFLNEKTANIDSLIASKQKLIELLKEERTAIINQAVTRGIDPNVKLKPSGIDWLGDIPEHWEVKKLKYVALKVQTGSTPPSNEEAYYKEEINWYTPADFSDHLKLQSSRRKIAKQVIDDEVVKVFPRYSVLMVGIGATLGKVGYVENESTSNQQINAISFKTLNEAIFYANYFYANKITIVSLANAATLAILNQTQTKDIIVPTLNDMVELTQIVRHIETETNRIDNTISTIKKEIELLQEYRTALISEVVTGKIKVT